MGEYTRQSTLTPSLVLAPCQKMAHLLSRQDVYVLTENVQAAYHSGRVGEEILNLELTVPPFLCHKLIVLLSAHACDQLTPPPAPFMC